MLARAIARLPAAVGTNQVGQGWREERQGDAKVPCVSDVCDVSMYVLSLYLCIIYIYICIYMYYLYMYVGMVRSHLVKCTREEPWARAAA